MFCYYREDEILEDIADYDFPRLLRSYEKRKKFMPHAYNLLKCISVWKRSAKYWKDISVLSPKDEENDQPAWKTNGTIIVILKNYCYDIFVNVYKPETDLLYEGLSKTKRIDWNNSDLRFLLVADQHISVINSVLGEKKMMARTQTHVMFRMKTKIAQRIEPKCESDVYVDKIDYKFVSTVDDIYPRRPDSKKYNTSLVEVNGAYGLMAKSNNEILCYVLSDMFYNFGCLELKKGYEDKDYENIVRQKMCFELGQEGIEPIGLVLDNNNESANNLLNMGFEFVSKLTTMCISPFTPEGSFARTE